MIGIKEEQLLKEISLKPRTLEEISKLMNLSERSVRYKIKDLNEFLKGENLEIEVVLKKNLIEIIGDITLLEKKINFLNLILIYFLKMKDWKYLLIFYFLTKINFKQMNIKKLWISVSPLLKKIGNY